MSKLTSRAAMLAFLVSAGCRDSSAVSGHPSPKHESDSVSVPEPCPKTTSGPLDAPLRHEKWTSVVDVKAMKAATSRMNVNREKLDGQPRVELLNHRAAISSAEGALDSANLTVDESCAKFVRAYSDFQDIVNGEKGSNDYRQLRDASDGLRSEIECWSVATNRRLRLEKIARQITSLASFDNRLPSKPNAAIAALRERWAILNMALRERESASARYARTAEEASKVVANAAMTARLSPSERTTLTTAFQELPKIHLIEQQLQFIAEYSQAVADEKRIVLPRDLMCWTLRLLDTPSTTRQDASTGSPAELHEQWQQRLEVVHDVIAQALAVPGAEW